jgi:hypothetical protein
MVNIAELLSPRNSGNSCEFQNFWPELPVALALMYSGVLKDQSVWSARNFGSEFGESSGSGIARNSQKFLGIPDRNYLSSSLSCIVMWSKMSRFKQHKFWNGIPGIEETRSNVCRSFMFNDDRVPGIARNWFRNVQHREIGWLFVQRPSESSESFN